MLGEGRRMVIEIGERVREEIRKREVEERGWDI